ncbi:MAG TPA: hypothetical protein DER18_07355 [Shewanella baltica]|nr:hypothetical protein [Shewanella baltica]
MLYPVVDYGRLVWNRAQGQLVPSTSN